jgi:hypothetical protein
MALLGGNELRNGPPSFYLSAKMLAGEPLLLASFYAHEIRGSENIHLSRFGASETFQEPCTQHDPSQTPSGLQFPDLLEWKSIFQKQQSQELSLAVHSGILGCR